MAFFATILSGLDVCCGNFLYLQRQMGLDKDKPVFCICLSAHRSIAAQKLLTEEGFVSS